MESLYSTLHYWLVDHPTVSQFQWIQGQTFAATPQFLTTTVLTYLSLTFLLHRLRLPHLPSAVLRLFSVAHNLLLILLSFAMALGMSLSALSQSPNAKWIICFPKDQITPTGPVFFWAYVFYLSKILEFVDTLLIILAGSNRRLSFLHVYHHAVVVVIGYVWLSTKQSLFSVALFGNASVHTVMYAYYLLCALGRRPWWKSFVTDFQITQFVVCFLFLGLLLYYHFTGSGCSGIAGWCFNAVFNASLLYLFVDFRSKNYARSKTKKGDDYDENKRS